MTAIIIGMTIIVLSKVFQLHKPRNVDLVSKPGIIINIINYFPKIAPFLILIINTLPLFGDILNIVPKVCSVLI